MDKRFPWGIVASLVVIVCVSIGGGYLLYRIIDGATPLKSSTRTNATPVATSTTPAPVLAEQGTPGFLIVQMRATAEMSPDTGHPSFDAVLENKGFATACPGKEVITDHRSQAKDFWTNEEGATVELDSVVCLPALSTVSGAAFPGKTSSGRVTVDDTELSDFPEELFKTQGRLLYVETGKANYMLYAGGIAVKQCNDECEGGVSVGASVTRVVRPVNEDRFVFSVPVGDSKVVMVAASAPMAR